MAKLRAWFVIALDLINVIAYLILSHYNGTDIGERVNNLAFSMFPLVGAVLLARHPRNPVGYLITVLGLSVMGAGTLFEYAALSMHEETAGFPLLGEAAWVSMLLWSFVLPCLVLTLLFFPNGRLPGPGWKVLAIFSILVTLPVIIGTVVLAWPNRHTLVLMDTDQVPDNADMRYLLEFYDIWNLALITAVILAVVSFFVRFSRSRGIERQQLKWFVYGVSTIPISMVLEEVISSFNSPVLFGLNYALNIISIVALPVVMLIAITRYRLYDIDFIIRRTLLYSALTLTLALIYFGLVLLMQWIFTQQYGEQPALVIVISTLLIAALFQPLRLRFQSIIDRRFYRRKYNAEQTLERFAARLQNEVNLDEIQHYFIAFVQENIQPERVELWLINKQSSAR